MINHMHGIRSKAYALLLSMDRLELRSKEKAIEGNVPDKCVAVCRRKLSGLRFFVLKQI